jgi:hypothetical protein
LFRIGFWWVNVSIVVLMFLILLLFLNVQTDLWPWLFPLFYYWVPVVGFGIIGLYFYVVFQRNNINPILIMRKGSRELFFFCLLFIIIGFLFFEIISTAILIPFYSGSMSLDEYADAAVIFALYNNIFKILMYVAIIVTSLAFNKLVYHLFGPRPIRIRSRLNPRFLVNIALIAGVFACIFLAFFMAIGLTMSNEMDSNIFPLIHLGSDFLLVTGNIPFWLGKLLVIFSLVIILKATMDTLPAQYQHLVIGKSVRMDLRSIFGFSLILIVVSSILRMLTSVIITWRWYFGVEWGEGDFLRPTFDEIFIVNMYHITKYISPLIFYFGFALVCLCFHHIFRAWEYAKLAGAGKPT